MPSPHRRALDDIGTAFERTDGDAGPQGRGFAVRRFHLGRVVPVVGDVTTPATGAGALLPAARGPGETSAAVARVGSLIEGGTVVPVAVTGPTSKARFGVSAAAPRADRVDPA